jgi:branched-chain amino acid transport system permease protein
MSRVLSTAVGILALASVPLLAGSDYYINITSQILISAILAIGLNLLVGYVRLMSLAHAALFGVACYGTAIMLKAGYGHLPSAIVAIIATMVTTSIVATLALRATGIGFLMITLACGQIVWGMAYRWISLTEGDNGINIAARPHVLGVSLASPISFYFLTLAVFAVAFVAVAILIASPFGASLRGTRDQPRRMAALGYNVWLIQFVAFLVSGFWAGVAGLLFVYYNQFVSPQVMALTTSAEALLMVIVGGAATLLGPFVGAVIVVVVKNVVSAYVVHWNMVLGSIFVVIMIFMPEGLVPGTARLLRRVRTPRIGVLVPEPPIEKKRAR